MCDEAEAECDPAQPSPATGPAGSRACLCSCFWALLQPHPCSWWEWQCGKPRRVGAEGSFPARLPTRSLALPDLRRRPPP